MQMNSCRNCKEPIIGNYCSNCGQPAKLKRIDGQYMIHEIGDFFSANRGMIYTIKNILIRPGESVRHFIAENRYRFVKPITFLFITTLFYALVGNLFDIKTSSFTSFSGQEGMVSLLIDWLIEHRGYMLILVGLFVSFWLKIFFRKVGYNLFEVFILFCFIFGITMLFNSVAIIIQGITHLKLINISAGIGIIYGVWATVQFFDKKKATSYIKTLLSYILGFLTFGILSAVGAIIESAIKQ